MKKIISLILATLMIASLIPFASLATFAEATEESGNPVIEVYNSGEGKTTFASLLGTTLQANTTYKLMENIDLGGMELSTSYITLANGVTFDGQGHSISGFGLVTGINSALFNAETGNSTAATTTMKDITFGSKNAPITYTHAGGSHNEMRGFALILATNGKTTLNLSGLTAYIDGACKGGAWQEHAVFVARNWGTLNVDGCVANGTLRGHGFFGAFVGRAKGGKITIKNSTSNVNISADGSGFFGGFIGRIESEGATVSIIGCTNNGTLNAERAVGGFVGEIAKNEHVIITDSVNNGKTTAQKSTGGVVGLLTLGRLTAKRFTNNGAIEATKGDGDAGAILGKATAAEAAITVTECVNYGSVSALSGMAGGVVGKLLSASGSVSVTDFLNTGKINSSSAAGAAVGLSENTVNVTDENGEALKDENGKNITVKVDNSALTISATRLVNLGDIYAKWNAGAVTGWSYQATLNITGCINGASVSTSNKAADIFAKYEATPDNDVADATVTAEGNLYILDANTNNTNAEKKSAEDILAILTGAESAYKVGTYALNAAKNRLVALIPPTVEGAQIRDNADGTLSIRLVGTIHSLEYKEVGFRITVDGEEKDSLRRSTVHSSIFGKNSDGTTEELTALELGGAHIYAIALEGISATGSHTVYIVPFSARADGAEYRGVGYTLTLTDGELSSAVADEIKVEEEPEEEPDEPENPDEGETGGGTTEPEEPETDIPIVDDEDGSTLGPIIPVFPD